MFTDLPLAELERYHPASQAPADFDHFWQTTLAESRQFPLDAIFAPVASILQSVDVFDVTFNGYQGQPIKGWLLLPRTRTAPLPCVVEYLGYGGGRGVPHDWPLWSAVGYAHLIMDNRGQGAAFRRGDTPDFEAEGSSAQIPGMLTRGILAPRTYYYRRLFVDAVRAVEAAKAHPAIDAQRLIIAGVSQGGGIALAVAGLVADLTAVLVDVPFLCHYRVATEITQSHPYQEIAQFCRTHRHAVETVFQTLAYFDGVHFAPRATAPALFSAGLMDEVCPPRTVFAAYNAYAGQKAMRVWPYNGHEGGGSDQIVEQVQVLREILGDAAPQ
ncbi:MAG: acetylxylan esterase [Ktedonobacterales bacterium]|nr:acetylxylan esterase [Ktedonobacterales bacterium]